MRVDHFARRCLARSSWDRRAEIRCLTVELGPWEGAQFWVPTSNGDFLSVLIYGTSSSNDHGIPFSINRQKSRQIVDRFFTEVIYYRTPCLWCKTRPPGRAPLASRIHPLLRRHYRVPIPGGPWSLLSLGVLGQGFADFPGILTKIQNGGLLHVSVNIYIIYFRYSFVTINPRVFE